MCGIFSLINNDTTFTGKQIEDAFTKGRGRGPEFSKLCHVDKNVLFGFHRLAINGLNDESNQPLIIDNITLVCNGEIYNYKELYELMGIIPKTDSDCEIIIHLYKHYGIERALQMLDGVFAFILCDATTTFDTDCVKLYVARDPYGVRPLYQMSPLTCNEKVYGYASELKVLVDFYDADKPKNTITQFTPGTYTEFALSFKVMSKWKITKQNIIFHIPAMTKTMVQPTTDSNYMEWITCGIQMHFIDAIKKRCLTTERPIACLLSGGLDSSLVTALVNEEYKKIGPEKKLETYSIGLPGSEDLKYARIVADYLGTKHTEILVTEEEMLYAIPEVVRVIESYDTTTVRASIGNYLLGKYIAKHSDAKVIFNGDGSDELCGGYLYMYKAPNTMDFDNECRRLIADIHLYDVLRSDKSISSHGLEPRTPFLDKSWTNFYLSIPAKIRSHLEQNKCEKFLLRNSFTRENYCGTNGFQLLPDEILWRTKEAFSDGVSQQNRSLYEIIQDYVKPIVLERKLYNKLTGITHLKPGPEDYEKIYYRSLYEEAYPTLGHLVPYFWMPRFIEAADASARTLHFYKEIAEKKAPAVDA